MNGKLIECKLMRVSFWTCAYFGDNDMAAAASAPVSNTILTATEHDYLDTGDSQIIVHFVTISFKWSIRQIPSISWSRSFAASVLMAPVTNSSVTGFQPTIFHCA